MPKKTPKREYLSVSIPQADKGLLGQFKEIAVSDDKTMARLAWSIIKEWILGKQK